MSRGRHTSKLVSSLLSWFVINARDLPWRRTRDPYAIWVSEIMLQQTQVKTVIPYWNRWMKELPTIERLSAASADRIHKLWEGLGYYTRVRNMQKAAQQILASQSAVAADVSPLHLRAKESQSRLTSAATVQGSKLPIARATLSPSDGERDGVRGFPTNFDAVLALPGIGRYTAGAICSIAFNQPTPILDGNVVRVLTRIYGIAADPREKQTNTHLWQLAEDLVHHASRTTHHTSPCSHLNQSLMELGALVCTPRSPNCSACPVRTLCVARKEELQDHIPNLGKRSETTARRFIAFVVERNGKFLVRQRPAGVVNAHLWEFPNIELPGAPPSRRRVSLSKAKQHASETLALPADNFRLTTTDPLCTIKHSITRYRITLDAWHAKLGPRNRASVSVPTRNGKPARNKPGRRPALQGQWRTLAQLHQVAFTGDHKKILARLGAPIS